MTPGQVKDRARELGFIACGITDTTPVLHAAELDRWLENGYAGTMRYLHRQAKRRKEPALIAPEAKSVIVVLDNYFTEDEPGSDVPRVARYARGRDYHLDLIERLDQLAQWLRENGATFARSFADAGPVPERELAQRAGLGWIGKNTMLLRPGAGSFFFIGSIFSDLELPADTPFDSDRCGSCTRCIEACPTDAIIAPRVLDATRCISYLTIEYRGDFDQAATEKLAGWAFGCDICNEVCPWNITFAEPTTNVAYSTRMNDAGEDPEWFDRMSQKDFDQKYGDTPFSRPGLTGMRRNWRAAFSIRKPAS